MRKAEALQEVTYGIRRGDERLVASAARWAGRITHLEAQVGDDEMLVRERLAQVYASVMDDWRSGCTTSRDVGGGVEVVPHPDRLLDLANKAEMSPRAFGMMVQVARLELEEWHG